MAKQRRGLGMGTVGVGVVFVVGGAYLAHTHLRRPGPIAAPPSATTPSARLLPQSFTPAQAQISIALPAVVAPAEGQVVAVGGVSSATLQRFALGHAREGLVRLGQGRTVEPAAASSWQRLASGDWRFQLRNGALWSDGQPVTAQDFVEGWKARLKASHLEGPLARLANASAFVVGGNGATELGVAADGAKDDAVVIRFTPPLSDEDLGLLADPAFAPLKASAAATSGDNEFAEPFNGPFVPTWEQGHLLLKRNARYWALSEIGLGQIEARDFSVSQAAEVEQAFLKGNMAFVENPSIAPADQQQVAVSLRHAGVRGGVYLVVNSRAKSLKNPDLRRAFRLAINRDDLSQFTAPAGSAAGMRGLIPPGLPGVQLNYGSENSVAYEANPRLAEAAFAKVRKALGEHFPKVFTVVAQDLPASRQELEHLRQWLLANHQITLKLSFLSDADLAEQYKKPQASLYYLRETAASPDAVSYLKLVTAEPFTDIAASSKTPAVAKLLAAALAAKDPHGMFNAAAQAEGLLVEDAGVIGVLSTTTPYLQDPRLTQVRRRMSGLDPDFTRTTVSTP